MKTLGLICLIGFWAYNGAGGRPQESAAAAKSSRDSFVLFELFTSEGCSSCPPAEALMTALAAKHLPDVFILSFHVDYWDRLGWKDQFSNALYTRRQRDYASAMKVNNVYTPQLIVNGREQFVGSDGNKTDQALRHSKRATRIPITALTATTGTGSALSVSCRIEGGKDKIWNIALMQKQAETAVKRGENAGRQLVHTHIVRDFKSQETKEGLNTATLDIPGSLAAKDCFVIVYLQDPLSGEVLSVAQCGL